MAGISGVPPGLAVYPDTKDGQLPRDRRGRVKFARVYLATAGSPTVQPGDPVPDVDDRDRDWITAAGQRHWATVLDRWSERAFTVTHALCVAGVITVHTSITAQMRLDTYRNVQPRPEWSAWHAARRSDASGARNAWHVRATEAAATVVDLDPGLTAALRDPALHARLPVLVYAAEALAEGLWFDGPRAFSQTYFGDTKLREDAPAILLAAGAAADTLATIGLTRSAYIGIGGPIVVHAADRHADLTGFAGPVQLRTSPTLRLHVHPDVTTVLVVENLQAAETVCDLHSKLAVLWCVGQPSITALDLISSTAQGRHILIATDADLGGVRIANRIAACLQADARTVTILDPGTVPHPRTDRAFGSGSLRGSLSTES